MDTDDIAVGASAAAFGASSLGAASKAARGERLAGLDVVSVIASAASFALSVWRRQVAKRRRLAECKGEQAG